MKLTTDIYGGAIKAELMDHQQQMVDFAEDQKYVGLFGDYGVGKSLVALAITAMYRMRYVLIISTKSGIESTWPTELRKHTRLRWFNLQGTKKAKKASGRRRT